MKKYILLAATVLIWAKGYSQQDPQYTMYMFNQLAVNPAYAGSRECLSATAHYRTQWVGVEGAPKTLSFGIHSPLKNERANLGFQVVNDKLGISNFTNIALSYAYRIPVSKKAKLSIGMQAIVTSLVNRYQDATKLDPTDPNFTTGNNVTLPNFGAGIYYNTPRAYVGITLPHIINNKLDKKTGLVTNQAAQQFRHLYAMAGYVFTLSDVVKFKPSTLLKFAPNSPWEMDYNASFFLYDALWLGASWRSNYSTQAVSKNKLESLDFTAIYEINQHMRIGLAYDLTMTKLRANNKGSYEFLLGYDFEHKKDKILTPRYF